MVNVPSSGVKSKLFMDAQKLHDKRIEHRLASTRNIMADPLSSTTYKCMYSAVEWAAHRDSLPALSILTTVNVTFEDGYIHVDLDLIRGIVELMMADPVALTDQRNESNDGEREDEEDEE